VGDVELSAGREDEGRRGIIEGEVAALGNSGGTLEVDEDVERSLETTGDTLDSDVVTAGGRETVRDLPVALRASSETRGADLGNLAAGGAGRRLLIRPEDREGSLLDVLDLNDDLVALVVVILVDVDAVVDVALVGDKLESISVLLEAVADDVGTDKGGGDVVDLDGVTDGGLVEGRVGGGVLETDNGEVVGSISELARGDGDLTPVVGEAVSGGRVTRGALLDVVVARAVSGEVLKVVEDLDVSVLDVVDEEGDVVTDLGVLDEERVVLDLAGLDVGGVGLISTEGSDGVLEGGSQSELDGNVVELVLVSVNRDVVAATSDLAGLNLPRAGRLSLAAVEVVVALVLTGTVVLVEESSDLVLVAVGVELNEEVVSGKVLGDVDEEVLVTVVSNAAIDRDARDELGVSDLDNAELDGVTTREDGSKVALDGNKVLIISPLASGDDDSLVRGGSNVGAARVVEAAVASNATTVDKDVEGVTEVVVLGEEVAVLDVGDLDDEIVVGDGLGSNLVVSVLVGGVPLGDNVSDGLAGDEGLDDGSVVDGGSEGVTDGSGVLVEILVDTEDGDVPDSRAEGAGRDEDGAEVLDLVDLGEEVGDSLGDVVSASGGDGTSAVVEVVVARAVSSEVVVVDKSLEGLGDTVLDVGDLDGQVLALDDGVSADVVVVVLALKDVLRVRDGALDGEGDVKVGVEGVVDGHLVVGGVTIGRVTDVVAVDREVEGTLLELASLDHEGAGLAGVGTEDVVLSGASLDGAAGADVASEAVKVRAVVALTSGEGAVEHGEDDLSVLLLSVELNKKPSVDRGGNFDDVKVIEGLTNVLVDGDSGNEGGGDGILEPVGTDGVRDGETVIVINEESFLVRGNGDRDVPSSGAKVALLDNDVAGVISAAGGVGNVARLNATSTRVSLTVETLVDPDVNKAVADVVDVHEEVGLTGSDLRGGDVDLVVGETLRLDVTLVGGVAGELTDGGGDEGGIKGVVKTSVVVLVDAEGQLDGNVPSAVKHLARVDGEVASELATSSDNLFKGGALAALAGLGVDGVVEDELTSSGSSVDATGVDALVKLVVLIEVSVVEGGHGEVVVVETDDGSRGRDAGDVDEQVSSFSKLVLRDVDGIEGVVVETSRGDGDVTLVVEHDEGLTVLDGVDGDDAGGEVEAVRQDASGTSSDSDVVGSVLELAGELDETRGLRALPEVVVGTGELAEGVDDVVVVGEFLLEVVELRVDDVEGSKVTFSLGRLVKLEAEPVSVLDVGERLDTVVVKVAWQHSAVDNVASGVLADGDGLLRRETRRNLCRHERKSNQKDGGKQELHHLLSLFLFDLSFDGGSLLFFSLLLVYFLSLFFLSLFLLQTVFFFAGIRTMKDRGRGFRETRSASKQLRQVLRANGGRVGWEG
jgi:phosphotransferase system IIB component